MTFGYESRADGWLRHCRPGAGQSGETARGACLLATDVSKLLLILKLMARNRVVHVRDCRSNLYGQTNMPFTVLVADGSGLNG